MNLRLNPWSMIRPWLLRRPKSPVSLLFVHIPKTAGISLFSALEDFYGRENCIRWADSGELPHYLATPDEKLKATRVLSGHFTYPQFRQKSIGSRLVICLLREPLERILSMYYYLRSMPEHRRYHLVEDVSCNEYLERQIRGAHRNRQCLYFAGTNNDSDAMLAIEHEFDLVGTVERMEPFLTVLASKINAAQPLRLEHKNATRGGRPHSAQLDPELVCRFREAHADDYRLWERVMESNRGVIGLAGNDA